MTRCTIKRELKLHGSHAGFLRHLALSIGMLAVVVPGAETGHTVVPANRSDENRESAILEWDADGGADADWSSGTNWSDNAEPTSVDSAHVNGGYTAVVSQADEAVLDLYVGDTGFGTLLLTNGQLTVSDDLVLGKASGATGLIVVTNAILNVANDIVVGKVGEGFLTVSGGALTVTNFLRLGYGTGALGTLDLRGGSVTSLNDFVIGSAADATGIVTMTGGTLDLAADEPLRVGHGAGYYGEFVITNGGLTLSGGGDVRIGYGSTGDFGTGVFHIVGGESSINIADNFVMSPYTNAELKVTIVDSGLSTMNIGGNLDIHGALTVTNNTTPNPSVYLLATGMTETVSSVFDATNWNGGVEGYVKYGRDHVSLIFSPWMAIQGTNSAVIADGDAIPEVADGTQFTIDLPDSITNTFTITNQNSSYTLNLTGDEFVALSGPQSNSFSIVQPGGAAIAANGVRMFDIAFTPTYVGTHTALVTIVSDDLRAGMDTNTFTIHGIGTLTDQPTLAASGLSFSNVSNSQMDVSWTIGNGAGRILVARKSGLVENDPVDGTPYGADPGFSNAYTIAAGEYVVYTNTGTGTGVTITNLRPGVTYYVELFEYNGQAGGINYLENPSLTGSQETRTYAPVITQSDPVTLSTNENASVSTTLDATDLDEWLGDTVTWTIHTAPLHGTASVTDGGFTGRPVSYTPDAYYSGSDSFQVIVTDRYGNTDIIRVNVTVSAVNQPGVPVFIFE